MWALFMSSVGFISYSNSVYMSAGTLKGCSRVLFGLVVTVCSIVVALI